jgi:hypothetical protein
MRLYSDTLRTSDLFAAAEWAQRHGQDIYVEDHMERRGRKRAWSIEFHCASYHGTRKQNRGGSNAPAASWKAWGYLITYLFNKDANAIIGWYENPTHFMEQTTKMKDWRKKYDGENPTEFLEHLSW